MPNLNREYDCSSSHEKFLETLDELKEVYSRNFYPAAQVNSKIKILLSDQRKPVRKPTNLTVCFEYSLPLIQYVENLYYTVHVYVN